MSDNHTSDTVHATSNGVTSHKAVTDPADAGPSASQETTTPPQRSQPSPAVLGGTLGALGLIAALVAWLRHRRQPPTPAERLTGATKQLGTASMALGSRAAEHAASAAGQAAAAAAPVAAAAGALGGTALHAAGELGGTALHAAGELGGTAAHAASELGGGAMEAAERAGKVVAAAPAALAESVEGVRRGWSKLMNRMTILVFGGTGYVLGARAGRERYDQIVQAAQKLQQQVSGGSAARAA